MRPLAGGRLTLVVAQPRPEQAVGDSEAFRDQGHPGKEDMQGFGRGPDQVILVGLGRRSIGVPNGTKLDDGVVSRPR